MEANKPSFKDAVLKVFLSRSFLTALLLLLWGAGVLWLWRGHQNQTVLVERGLIQRGEDMSSTMEGMLRAMESRPGSPKRFLERTLKLLQKATQFQALGLADEKGKVLIDSGKKLHRFSESTDSEIISWDRSEGVAQLRIDLEVDAFNEAEAFQPIFAKERRDGKRGVPGKEKDRLRERFKQELRHRFKGEREKFPGMTTRERGAPPNLGPPERGHLQNPASRERGNLSGAESRERVERYETLIIDVPVKGQLRTLRLGFIMRVLIALSSLVAMAAVLWVLRRQEHLHKVQVQLREQEQIHKNLEEKNLAALGLAHETRTPLGVLRGHAQLNIDDDNASEEVHDRSLIIVDEVDRITSRLNDFISYARQPSPEMSPHDLRELTRKVMDLLRLDLEDKQISVRVEIDQLKIMADGDMMVQVLFNLLMNASQILPEGGEISLRTESRGDSVDLHVIDNGPGFPRDLGESCFQPYVTQREGGTGLGLAVVQQILVSHGANLELLESEEGAHLLISGLRKSTS